MSIDNYIVTADLSFNNIVRAVENIDGNRFAVGGAFTNVIDSTGEVKDCSYCGIFNKEGELVVPFNFNDNVLALANLDNNRLAVGGDFTKLTDSTGTEYDTSHCAIVKTNGTFDTSFNFNERVLALARLSDVSFAVGGEFTKLTTPTGARDTSYCAIVTTGGEFDVSFNFNEEVLDLARLSDVSFAVGGEFTKLTTDATGAVDTSCCAIVNTDGTFDTSFNFGIEGSVPYVNALANLDNNRLAVGGGFTKLTTPTGARDTSYCAIVKTDGEFDTSFNFNNVVYALASLGNNRLAVGGEFTELDGDSTTSLAVVDPNSGSLTKRFSNIAPGSRPRALADLGNNHLVVGGGFTNMHNDCPGAPNGTPCQHLAILYNTETILEPTTQQVTESVKSIPGKVPTPGDEVFTPHISDTAAQKQAKANGQDTFFYANGKYLCKNPNYCLDIEKKGFNNFKISKKKK